MLRASPSLLRRAVSLRPAVALTPRRHQSQETPQGHFIQDHFVTSAGIAVNLFARFIKFSLLGALGFGLTGLSVYEGIHVWVESVELASHLDDETRRWEWHQEAERWTGGEHGGTDPALGFRARHLLRSSWMAENWGVGSITFSDNGGMGGLNAIEARLDFAQHYLGATLRIAEERITTLRPQTLNELLVRHGSILERIGTREALFESRSEYERAWAGLPGKGSDAARVASKLGDLNFRLGDSSEALAWWTRSLSLSQGTRQSEGATVPVISQTTPSSPSAQRTLTSTLVSLSAYYSTSGHLKEARQLQETILGLLRSISSPSPSNIAAASPPQMLHSLYLLHRSSLISIHLAEVLYALHSPRQSSFDYLTRAAESSERVALALTGLPFNPDIKGSHTPAPNAPILPVFVRSHATRKPATGLLHYARRTAAEAWNLMGVLNEEDGDMERALTCFERAVGWAGVESAGEGTLEADWKVMWANYSRARDATRKPL